MLCYFGVLCAFAQNSFLAASKETSDSMGVDELNQILQKTEFRRQIDKSEIPVCNILGVNIAAVNMQWLLTYLKNNIKKLSGDYITVANVHTTVTAFEDKSYLEIQNDALMAIPDGGPLSSVGRKRGYEFMERTTGPSLMEEIFKISQENGYSHYFYGSTQETLEKLKEKLFKEYIQLLRNERGKLKVNMNIKG